MCKLLAQLRSEYTRQSSSQRKQSETRMEQFRIFADDESLLCGRFDFLCVHLFRVLRNGIAMVCSVQVTPQISIQNISFLHIRNWPKQFNNVWNRFIIENLTKMKIKSFLVQWPLANETLWLHVVTYETMCECSENEQTNHKLGHFHPFGHSSLFICVYVSLCGIKVPGHDQMSIGVCLCMLEHGRLGDWSCVWSCDKQNVSEWNGIIIVWIECEWM